jgi:hypothetical protein
MKTTTLNFYERIVTAEIVGQQEGRLADISAYLRILDKIRITEEERKSSNMEVADGQLRWQIPSQDIGSSQVMLEDQEARRLSDLFENWPKVTIRDVAWIERVVANLRSERRTGRRSAHECPTKRVTSRSRSRRQMGSTTA